MSDVMHPLRGRDPYDALLGRRVPRVLVRSARGRQLAIQLRKRCPVDLGGLMGVRPFVMAKTLACHLTASARGRCDGPDTAAFERALLDRRVPGGGWGYEFDVQTRWGYYPAGSANTVVTSFSVRALVTALSQGVETPGARAALDAALDLMTGPLSARSDVGPYVRYTATSDVLVHNANLLACGVLAALGRLLGREEPVKLALTCARTTIAAQRPDGSWPYGASASLGWSDNFHTAYNLDGLLLVWLATADARVRESLDAGVAHWTRDFFGPRGEPKYYPDRAHPYDIHSAASAIDIAARLATWGLPTEQVAWRVAEWTDANLVDSRHGGTYYQRHRLWTDRRHFVRWGDAHLAMGRASLALLDTGARDPLEAAVRHG